MEVRDPNFSLKFGELGHYKTFFIETWKKQPALSEGG